MGTADQAALPIPAQVRYPFEIDQLSLREARECWLAGDPFGLRAPTVALLDAIPWPIDHEAAAALVTFLARYPAFEPPLADDAREELLFALVARSEGHPVPFEVALRVGMDGTDAVRRLLDRIPARELDERALQALALVIEYLLDNASTYAVVADAGASWPDTPSTRAIRQVFKLAPGENLKMRDSPRS